MNLERRTSTHGASVPELQVVVCNNDCSFACVCVCVCVCTCMCMCCFVLTCLCCFVQLTKLQDENDNLVGKHSKTAQQLQNEDINLPNNLEVSLLILFL